MKQVGKNYTIEMLDDVQYNKNIKTRRIIIQPKREDNLLKKSDIETFYNSLKKEGYKDSDISIQIMDAFGESMTIKGYDDDNIAFHDDYASDRVKNNTKFQVATKVGFFIHI